MQETSVPTPPPVERIRHAQRRRTLTVAARERLTPHMIRLTLKGLELHGFASLGADDHLKLIVPDADGGEVQRDIPPRRFDAEAGDLVIDILDHGAGPAADWARSVQPGDPARIGGPRGSAVIGGGVVHWLLIGDETALPAIGRRIEELPAGIHATSLVAVPGPEDGQLFRTRGTHRPVWIHRPLSQAARSERFLAALDGLKLPARSFVWIAAEAAIAREIRARFLLEGHDPAWMKTSGYWTARDRDAAEAP